MNQWFTFSKSILCYAGEFARFACKAAVLRGMPRTEPGTFLRGDYEIKLNITYFCLSPLLLAAAVIFGVSAILMAMVSAIIGTGVAVVTLFTPGKSDHSKQQIAISVPAEPKPANSHTMIVTKLNENQRPDQAAKPINIPVSEVPVDEVIETSEDEYSFSTSQNSTEGPSLFNYLLGAFG